MDNVRFATALHILTLLAQSEDWVGSAYIASSINVNPAVVRKELIQLKSKGLVETREGKGGGSQLAKPSNAIRLSEVYEAVNQSPILGRTNTPNPLCPVGRQINDKIFSLYNDAEQALMKHLATITLRDFCKQFD